jgi:C1A family cysteine protease
MPDHRDFKYGVYKPDVLKGALPTTVDLRKDMPAVYDQGQLGACTGNGIAACLAYLRIQDSALPDWNPSRLFIYYGERVIENTVNSDAGAEIRDGIKVVATLGAPPESKWAYNVAKFATKPTKAAYNEAIKHKAMTYYRVDWSKLDEVKTCLAAGFPIVFGFSVYEAFEGPDVARTGVLHMPAKGEKLLGGHCVALCGYNDTTEQFLVRNSWGPDWGQNGYFWMPYEYVTSPDLSDDFWTIRATL